MCLGPKCEKYAKILKIGWLLTELWSICHKNVNWYNNISTDKNWQFLTITQPIVNRFSKFWPTSHTLEKGTTFLFNDFFRFITQKYAFLRISQKVLCGGFSFPCIIITYGPRYNAPVPVWVFKRMWIKNCAAHCGMYVNIFPPHQTWLCLCDVTSRDFVLVTSRHFRNCTEMWINYI